MPKDPAGTGGAIVDLRSFRNRSVPFDRQLYDEVLRTFPEEPLEPGSAVTVRRITRDEAMAAYDRVAAAADGAPGVLAWLAYRVRVAPDGITHSSNAFRLDH